MVGIRTRLSLSTFAVLAGVAMLGGCGSPDKVTRTTTTEQTTVGTSQPSTSSTTTTTIQKTP
jgi:hypothetical protein